MIGSRFAIIGAVALCIIIGAFALFRWGALSEKHDMEIDNANAATDAAIAALGRSECRRLDGVFWDFGASECRRDEGGGRD